MLSFVSVSACFPPRMFLSLGPLSGLPSESLVGFEVFSARDGRKEEESLQGFQ